MDGLELGAVIGAIALIVLTIVIMPMAAARHDRRTLRGRRCPDDGGTAAIAATPAIFGGDGGANCSDGGGGSC